jgi:soluble P-type ATPase
LAAAATGLLMEEVRLILPELPELKIPVVVAEVKKTTYLEDPADQVL